MKFPSLKRIPLWWRRLHWNEENIAIMLTPKELRKVYFKFALYCYYLMAIKIYEVLEIVFDGYQQNQHIFVPVEERFEYLYRHMFFVFNSLGNRPDFGEYEVSLLKPFSHLNGDFNDSIEKWLNFKSMIKAEIEQLGKRYPQPYIPPNDLQVLIGEINIYLEEHKAKKEEVLNRNKDILLQHNELGLNRSTSTLIYKTKSHPIQINRKEIKLLIELLIHKGKVVTYQELAEKLDVATNTPDTDLPAIKDSIKFIKRDLGKYLIEVGIHSKSVSTIMKSIQAIKNQGYQLKS